jgi:putative methyltransferase (TIGR04325 family)
LIAFEGDYDRWDQAKRESGGYDSAAIAQHVLEAALKVKRGEAVDERDAVTFDEMMYSYPVLAALCRQRAARARDLHVVDYGGALGRTYRHYKTFVGGTVSWSVVELPAFVALGKEHFENDELRFFGNIDASLSRGEPDVVVLSSVLQYLERPYDLVQRLLKLRPAHIVVDRTPCSRLDRDVLTVQKVPPRIYPASYPCWVFSLAHLLAAFAAAYRPIARFQDCSGVWEGSHVKFELEGLMLDILPASASQRA